MIPRLTPTPMTTKRSTKSPGPPMRTVTSEQSAEFVLEAHLEEFLVGNWKSIRWGRPLEIWTGPDGQPGHQLVTPIGRLDFLCTDPQTGALVVVELKRGRPSDKVVGQARPLHGLRPYPPCQAGTVSRRTHRRPRGRGSPCATPLRPS